MPLKPKKIRNLLIGVVLLLMAGGVLARGALQGDQCSIAPEEVIRGMVFVLCGELRVDGVIEGDLLGIANRAIINGEVQGDVYLVGSQLDVAGVIGEDLHFGGLVLNIHPQARFASTGSDLLTLSLSTRLQTNGALPGSVVGIGYQLIIDGEVGEEVNFWGSALQIHAPVGGAVTASVGDPASDVTQLRGFVELLSLDAELVAPGFEMNDEPLVAGVVTITRPAPPQDTTLLLEEPISGLGVYVQQVLREFTTFVVIGFVGLLLAPRALNAPIFYIRLRPLPSLGVGLLAFIVSFPTLLIVVVLTLIIILVFSLLGHSDLTLISTLFLGVADLGGATLFYFTAIFLTRVVVSLAIGRVIVRRLFGRLDSWFLIYASMAVGSLALAMLAGIPVIGIGFTALAVFIGLGGILNAIQAERIRQQLGQRGAPRETVPQLPEEVPLGMENLPEGFSFEQWQD